MATTGRIRSMVLSAGAPTTGRLRSMTLKAANPLLVTTDGDKSGEPGEILLVTASCPGTVSAWTCTQVSGTPVNVSGAGATRQVTMPYTISPTSIVLRWYAAQGATVSDPVFQTITCYPQQFWYLGTSGAWIPKTSTTITSITPGQFLDTYVDSYSEAHTT